MHNMTLIGRAEPVDFPEMNVEAVVSRIDTGAKTSSIWASEIIENNGKLSVVFFGSGSPFFTGERVEFDNFKTTVVASSNGISEERYKIKLLIRIGGRLIRAQFTVADRSTQVYPILIGRNVLRGKFVVDVTLGTPLEEEESERSKELQSRLRQGESS